VSVLVARWCRVRRISESSSVWDSADKPVLIAGPDGAVQMCCFWSSTCRDRLDATWSSTAWQNQVSYLVEVEMHFIRLSLLSFKGSYLTEYKFSVQGHLFRPSSVCSTPDQMCFSTFMQLPLLHKHDVLTFPTDLPSQIFKLVSN